MAVLAAIPIGLALLLLVGARWPARIAMPICAGITLLLAWGLWRMPTERIAASIVEAGWITVSILMIVFGALFFLEVLRQGKAIEVLQRTVSGLSRDARIQAVLVGWTLGSFLEGSAGFGAPAAITAPLLIGLGFPPVQAVVVALVGDSTAVSFGAIGTPMLIGFGQGLAQAEDAPAVIEIATRIARLDLILGTLMPAILVITLMVSSHGRAGWRLAWPAVPLACVVGFAQAVTSWLVVVSFGPELPSLIGPLVGLATAFALLRSGWLVPQNAIVLRKVNAKEQTHEHATTQPTDPVQSSSSPGVTRAVMPYVLLVCLLVVTRLRSLPLGAWLSSVSIGWSDLFGTGISAQLQPLYSPGTIFVACTLLSAWLLRSSWQAVQAAAATAGRTTLHTAIALLASIITVRIFLQSGGNTGGHPSMPLVLAEGLAGTLGGVWQAVAPCIGSLGSFMSGSATFSNMLFAWLQFEIASDLGYNATTILALQGIGAAAGNMTCIHNVVAACAVAGTLGQEGQVIRQTVVPMMAYLVIAGLLGLL